MRLESDVLIAVHNSRPPRDEEWAHYVDTVSPRVRSQIVFSNGGGPTAKQRKLATTRGAQVFERQGLPIPRSAVMTPSPAVRGLVTLFNWIFPGRFRAFRPDDFDGAFAYAEVPEQSQVRLKELIEEMYSGLS